MRYCSAGYLHKDEILLSLIYARLASNVTRSPAWIIDISLKYRVNIFGGSKVELSRRGFATIARNFLVLHGVYRGGKEKEEEGREIFLLFEPRGGNVAPPRIEKFNKRQYFPGNRSREGMIATRIPREKVPPSLSSRRFLRGIRGNPFEQDRKFPRPFSYPHPHIPLPALKRRPSPFFLDRNRGHF